MQVNYLDCQYNFKDKIENKHYCQHMYNFHNLCICNDKNNICKFLKFHHITKIPDLIISPNKEDIFEACKDFSKEYLKNLNSNESDECDGILTELTDIILLSLYGDRIFKWIHNRELVNSEKMEENIMTFTKTEIDNIKFKKTKEKLVNEIEGNFEDVAKSKTLQDLYDNLDYLITICSNYLEELDGEIND
jgi:hypothetical protein